MAHKNGEAFGHRDRSDRKNSGATYTPVKLAKPVSRSLIQLMDRNANDTLRVLDPGCGDGTLTATLLGELNKQKPNYSNICVTCIDTDKAAINMARERLTKLHPEVEFRFVTGDFIDFALNERKQPEAFDLVIANPPYVRIQALSDEMRARIKRDFNLSGRTDLAFPFILSIQRLLAPDGCAAVITSNSVLNTAAGNPVREALLSHSRVREVWDLGDSKLFEAAVLPAVLFFSKPSDGQTGSKDAGFTSLYEDPEATEQCEAINQDLCNDLIINTLKQTPDGKIFRQKRGHLRTDGAWRLATQEDDRWLSQITSRTWKEFKDISRISVGIKTTADKVFIAKSWDTPHPELLRPLITHHIADRFRATGAPQYSVLYTHEVANGKRAPVDLAKYPISARHLDLHKSQLSSRAYVQKAGREWFEIWVPHNPDDWAAQKVVFRDISQRPTFWIEDQGAIVNGDCYWIKLQSDQNPDLIWLLLAIGNSRMIERFYDLMFNDRIYAGRRRFMTRHVKQFPIPDPQNPFSIKAASAARQIYEERLYGAARQAQENEMNRLLDMAFGIS